jgi:hypothetical protein
VTGDDSSTEEGAERGGAGENWHCHQTSPRALFAPQRIPTKGLNGQAADQPRPGDRERQGVELT